MSSIAKAATFLPYSDGLPAPVTFWISAPLVSESRKSQVPRVKVIEPSSTGGVSPPRPAQPPSSGASSGGSGWLW